MAQNSPDIFDEFLMMIGELDNAMLGSQGGAKRGQQKKDGAKEPLVDIADDGETLIIVAELRGVAKDTILVKVVGNILEIKAELKGSYIDEVEPRGKKEVICMRIRLPASVDAAKMSRFFNNGVLEVRIPKAERETMVKNKND